MSAKRKPKKAKPSFDVARGAVTPDASAWVYRSDAAPPVAAREPASPLPAATAPSEPVARDRIPPASRQPEPSRVGWIGAGLGIMALPLTLTVMALTVPVLWIAGARPGR
jgi:hypothetical protein